MPTNQIIEQDAETVVELPELEDSQLVFEHSTQASPAVCTSAGDRAS
ncbi:hypothetical protein [Streptomyces sp. NPDC047123]